MANTPAPSTKPNILRLIAIIILSLIIISGLAVLIAYLAIRPKRLIYSIENASIHNYNLTHNTHLKADFNFSLRAYNPNTRVSIYYDKIETTAFYDDVKIAVNWVNPFYQPRRNVTHLGLNFAAENALLSESAVRDWKMERTRGRVNLEIKVKAKVRFKVGKLKSRHRTIRIECGPVTVPFSSSKNFNIVECDVDI